MTPMELLEQRIAVLEEELEFAREDAEPIKAAPQKWDSNPPIWSRLVSWWDNWHNHKLPKYVEPTDSYVDSIQKKMAFMEKYGGGFSVASSEAAYKQKKLIADWITSQSLVDMPEKKGTVESYTGYEVINYDGQVYASYDPYMPQDSPEMVSGPPQEDDDE